MTPRAGDPHIGLVVEGKADADAVPLLLRRYLHECGYFHEDWLHASIETLDLGAINYAEGGNGERIITSALKARGDSYSKPYWQPHLTERVDIDRATRRSASLSRLFDRLDGLLSELDRG